MNALPRRAGTLLMLVCAFLLTTVLTSAADTVQPTVVGVSPANNERGVETHDLVTVQFSEPMDARSLTRDTFTVTQTTVPDKGSPSTEYRSDSIAGTITYAGLMATFTPEDAQQNPLQPNQRYGNVFTVTITPGVRDLAGNTIARDYVWSFTTGGDTFNTGDATSQTDQSSTMVPSPVPPALTPAPAPAPAVTTTSIPWGWIIAVALIAVVLLILFLAFMTPSREKKVQPARAVATTRTSPFGDVHPLIELEGIGPEYNARLAAMDIRTSRDLWNANAGEVAIAIDVPQRTVESWQHMAELSSVKDIGPQYAELLERSGIHTIALLKKCTPDALLALVRKKQDSLKVNIQGNSLGRITVANWIDQARSHAFTAA